MLNKIKGEKLKLCVTGAFGFIGKNFLLKAHKDWEIFAFDLNCDIDFLEKNNLKNVISVSLNLSDKEQLVSTKEKFGDKFDVVLYLAANSDPAVSVKDPLFDLNSNTFALVNFLNNFSCDKLIFFSSGVVYDGLGGFVSPDSKINPKIPYAISKFSSEQYVKFFYNQGRIKNYQIIRFFGAFGPYEAERKIYTKLIKTFGLEDKSEFTVRGDGNSLIDAMYVEDAVEGILKIISSEAKSQVFDFGVGNPLTINELVEKTANVLGKEKITILHEGEVPEYIKFRISPQKFEEAFSFKRKFSLEEGIINFKSFLKNSLN